MKWNRLWPLGLGLLTALVLVLASEPSFVFPVDSSAHRQGLFARAVEVGTLVAQESESEESENVAPDPEAQPQEESTEPATSETPPTTVEEAVEGTPLVLSENLYRDPNGRFQVGILAQYDPEFTLEDVTEEVSLEEYRVSAIGGIPLIEAPDGNLAYTVVVQPLATTRTRTNEELAEIAIAQFERGEGFQPGEFQVMTPGQILISWTGVLNGSQGMSGAIVARQTARNVYLLLISATEAGEPKLEEAIALLSSSLAPL